MDTLLVICDALEGTIRNDRTEDFKDILKLCNDWETSVLLSFAELLINSREK